MRTDLKKLYFERALRKRFPRRPPKRLPRLLYPEKIEQRYRVALDELLKALKAKVDAKLKPLLPKLVKRYERTRVDAEEAGLEKYYTAFVYAKTDEPYVLHCTHKYLGALSRETALKIERAIDEYFLTRKPALPRVAFTKRGYFGPEKDIAVLLPENSEAFDSFAGLKSFLDSYRDDEYPFNPHVSTEATEVDRPFSHYALITKKGIVRTWPETERMDADDVADLTDLAAQLEAVRIEINQDYTKEEIKRLAKQTGESIATWNERQMNGQLKGIAEIDVFGNEPWIARELGGFVVNNVALIQSIETEYLAQVEKLVATSVRAGVRVEDLASELEDRYDVSRSRAELIARDQVGKFQGQLTELRQTDLGIEKYIRRGVGDARERDSHRELNNLTFSWDDPPEVGHPGEDFQCRCWAEPDLSQFFGD